ncbi:MAG: DUF4112 domain-containing protein, partial [Rhodoplanes sp.]
MSSIDARAFPYEFVRPRSRRDRLEQLARLDAFANLFDTAFVIPGTNVRFGIDALIGLAPGIGAVITPGMSRWLLYEARKLGAPWHVIGRMLGLAFTVFACPHRLAVDGDVTRVPAFLEKQGSQNIGQSLRVDDAQGFGQRRMTRPAYKAKFRLLTPAQAP